MDPDAQTELLALAAQLRDIAADLIELTRRPQPPPPLAL
jgi:hypothetical protein